MFSSKKIPFPFIETNPLLLQIHHILPNLTGDRSDQEEFAEDIRIPNF